MKAKDLAALAALGVAGFAASDKFGKKEAPAKKKMGEGLDMTNQGAYERATRPTPDAADVEMGTKGAYLPETAELRTKGAYLDDTPELRTKGAYLDERATPVAVASQARTPAIQTRSLAAPAPATEQPIYDNDTPVVAQKPDATRVKQYNPDIMYADTVSADNRPASGSMNHLAYKRNQRAGVVPSQMPNDAAAARVARQSASASELASRQAAQAQTPRPTAPAAPPAAAPVAAQNRYTKDQYGNIIDNVTGKVSRTIFSAGQEGNAARNGMKRGGAVKKMASGGLASSKPSSASSRGDGIAQRGKTRGTMR